MNDRAELHDRSSAAVAIQQLDEDDLRFLNRLIVQRLNLLAQIKSSTLMARLNLGDRVRFTLQDGQSVTGRVMRLNKKTASVLTDDGVGWKVAPAHLERIGTNRA
jgi:hypothetical protein